MKLYYMQSQGPRRVCALAKHLGLEVEYVNVGPALKSPEYMAINPLGLAPTLDDGGRIIWESIAISVHLCREAGSDMWPVENADEQVEVLRWLAWDAWHWAQAVGQSYFEVVIKPVLGMGPPDEAAMKAAEPGVRTLAAVLEAHLKGREWVAADRVTIADFALGAMIADWEAQKLPFGEFPNIAAWNERLLSIPAWRDPWPAKSVMFPG